MCKPMDGVLKGCRGFDHHTNSDIVIAKGFIMQSELLDQQLLAELESVLADDFNLLLETFLLDSEQRHSSLKALVASESWQEASAMAHSFKGSASNLGALALASVCSQLEHATRGQKLDSINQLMNELEDCYLQSVKALKQAYV